MATPHVDQILKHRTYCVGITKSQRQACLSD